MKNFFKKNLFTQELVHAKLGAIWRNLWLNQNNYISKLKIPNNRNFPYERLTFF